MYNEYAALERQIKHLKEANKLHRQQIALNQSLINELQARMKVLEEDEDNAPMDFDPSIPF